MNTALVFPGQGAQYVGMGLSLHENSSVARGFFLEAEDLLGSKFLEVCFRGPEEILTRTRTCQPALFTHGCAAVAILRKNNPEKICELGYGLSIGELTALCVAGVFDFTVGLKVVATRGRLMDEACEKTDGAMLCLIGGIRDDIDALCEETGVEIANINCPGQIVVSGETRRIKLAMATAEKMAFKRVLPLNVAGAYHSRLMESAAVEFERFLKDVEFDSPKFKVLSNVTGGRVESADEIKRLLAKQIISPVLFEKCCRCAVELGIDSFYECGPGRTLAGMLKKIDGNVRVKNFDKISDFDPLPNGSHFKSD